MSGNDSLNLHIRVRRVHACQNLNSLTSKATIRRVTQDDGVAFGDAYSIPLTLGLPGESPQRSSGIDIIRPRPIVRNDYLHAGVMDDKDAA